LAGSGLVARVIRPSVWMESVDWQLCMEGRWTDWGWGLGAGYFGPCAKAFPLVVVCRAVHADY
jgi:hypothetical protein